MDFEQEEGESYFYQPEKYQIRYVENDVPYERLFKMTSEVIYILFDHFKGIRVTNHTWSQIIQNSLSLYQIEKTLKGLFQGRL